ncbi:MAG: AmmeMemoRadiSam system protein B [Chloroflexi bacterium]|nr:AmmeMemoRadiSam system protein B [Chloroflexota bacterium]
MPDEIRPKLRHINISRSQQQGQPVLVLQDPCGISDFVIVLPANILPVLELCDGTRNIATIRSSLELRSGLRVGTGYLEKLFAALDDALLLDSERFATAYEQALGLFRASPVRSPILVDKVYPAAPELLEQTIRQYFDGLSADVDRTGSIYNVRGLVSPHIDYQRGGSIYAGVWHRAAAAAREAELAIILGTNHQAGHKLFTLTKKSYATPWGELPVACDTVDAVAKALGEKESYEEEFSHRNEHSVEAAAVWLHYFSRNRQCEIVPVLCGSFQRFIEGDTQPGSDDEINRLIDTLRKATSGRRTLIVAAGDLAHVGPAFGDIYPIDALERAKLSAADNELVTAVIKGDAEEVFQLVKQERDRRRICGLSTIYLAMRLLGKTKGELTGYAQCPADQQGASFVSICGIVLA